jgi:DNA replication and repair protein RecF
VILEKCKLYNFRNLSNGEVLFAPGVNLIHGNNGQGKTNLIEAIYLLSQGRSLRAHKLSELIKHGEKEGSVFGLVRSKLGEIQLGVVVRDGHREIYKNGDKQRSLATIIGEMPCVCFTPDDLAIVKSSPDNRRSFVDKHIIDIDKNLAKNFLSFQKAIKNKTATLKSEYIQPDLIKPWNKIIAENAEVIIKARRNFIGSLSSFATERFSYFAPSDPQISLGWEESINLESSESATGIENFLNDNIGREIAARAALFGPHRDDLIIYIGDHHARSFASQGQCRSIVLSLMIGVIDLIELSRGDSPLILLDDVDSELDQSRRGKLFELLFSAPRQLFISGTSFRELPKSESLLKINVNNGEYSLNDHA